MPALRCRTPCSGHSLQSGRSWCASLAPQSPLHASDYDSGMSKSLEKALNLSEIEGPRLSFVAPFAHMLRLFHRGAINGAFIR